MNRRTALVSVALATLVVAGTLVGQPPAAQDPPPVQGDTRDAADVMSEGGESQSSWPEWSDRWLFNADERTRSGRQALDAADTDRAVERLDTALRMRPDDAVARYNAGTARLTDQRPGARELLEAAAREATERVKAPASYNLGNAKLGAGDLPGAIAAYEDALRADPDFADAKHNLEVALRKLQQQQQDQQNQDPQNQDQEQDQEQQDQQQQDQQEQDQQEQDQEQEQDQDQEQQDQQQQDQEQEQEQESDETEESGGAGQGGEESPLPQFKDLPDMTAEEAAAILEAIQNMERQDRREQALEAAKKAEASGKKDW